MEKTVIGKRASENQKEYLVNFLLSNKDIANDKFVTVDGAKFRDARWDELAVELNSLGGTQKSGAKWRKYWSDLRVHTKAKYSTIRQEEQRSGVNGLRRAQVLSSLEEKVIEITTIESVDGDNTCEIGFGNNSLYVDAVNSAKSPAFVVDDTDIIQCDFGEETPVATGEATKSCVFEGPPTSRAAASAAKVFGSTATTAVTKTAAATISVSAITTASVANAARTRTPRVRVQRAQKRRRDFQDSDTHMEKLMKLEEKKLKEMELANDLKKEQLKLIKEQAEAIKEDTELKKDLCEKLQEVIEVFKGYTN